MKNLIAILFFLSILKSINSFQLQGTWSVTEIKGFPVIYESVTLQISDSVYRNTSILQNIVITGCQSYQYLMEFNENNLFISYSSIQFNQLSVNSTASSSLTKCTSDAAKMHSAIRSNLVEVFYFQLIGNYLVFLNPKRQIVFKFQRVQSSKIRNLRGIWNITNIKGTKTSQKIQIADTEITLCSGKLILGYILSDKYGFKTRLIQNDGGCEMKDLDKYMLSSAFLRRIGNVLEIYDTQLSLVMVMSFVSDIDLGAIQARRLKAIEEAKKSQQQAAQIQQQKQQQLKANQSALIKTQYQQQSSQLTLTLTNTKSDLLGIWQPLTVMGIPISTQTNIYYFIISTNTISINGGCNNFQFQYSQRGDAMNNNNNLNNRNKNIQIGQNKSSSEKCKIDDDGLYVNGMVRVKGYSISVVGNEIRLRLTDANGNVVYQVRKGVAVTVGNQQQQSSTTVVNSNTNINTNSPSQQQQLPTPTNTNTGTFQSGKYVFLILARRDLPRKFCTITNNKITYSGCNTIQHTIKILGNNLVQIIGGPITNNTCSINNDSIMINAFNSIVSFTVGKEAGSYVLKSGNNVDVINFSLF